MAGQLTTTEKTWGSLYLTDHLGSTRAVVDDGGNVLETFDYYPFGLLMPKRSSTTGNTIEKFTGKERDESLGLDYFGARYLDPALGRFLSVDRFADKMLDITPYNYAGNNPMGFIDVNGDSLIRVQFEGTNGLITSRKPILIDHRFKSEFVDIVSNAVTNGINVQINSSFRSTKKQQSDEIQKEGTTPAKEGSKHTAGLAIDFNLFEDNDRSKGALAGNKGQTGENNVFIQGIENAGARFGGNFSDPDPIHLDAGNQHRGDIQRKYGVSFEKIQKENNDQFKNRPNSIRTVRFIFFIKESEDNN